MPSWWQYSQWLHCKNVMAILPLYLYGLAKPWPRQVIWSRPSYQSGLSMIIFDYCCASLDLVRYNIVLFVVTGDWWWWGWCCIFIINSISREDHLSGGGSRPSYWGWMDVFRPHYLYLNGKLKYSTKYWHNINTNTPQQSNLPSSTSQLDFSFEKFPPNYSGLNYLSPSPPQPLFKQRDHQSSVTPWL